MYFRTEILPAALLAVSQVYAAPLTSEVPAELMTRDYQQFKGCSADQTNKIKAALSDAAVLARFVSQNKDGKSSFATDSSAFKNYFSADEWTTGVQSMYQAIGTQYAAPAPINGEQQPTVNVKQFTVIVSCQDTNNLCQQKGTASLAITDVTPRSSSFTPTLLICPAFFNDARTKNNLNSMPYKLNPGRRDASWCKSTEKFSYFEVAGHTILHELTHLNEAGAAAGLASHAADPSKPKGAQTQGTEDINGMKGYSTDPEAAARQLRTNWQKIEDTKPEPPESTWPPFVEKLNAESYAAAALEWWFTQQCQLASIPGN